MAGSRVEKFRSIYQRLQGLLKSGAVTEVNKPIWYDVYEAFPPLVEPRLDRKPVELKDGWKGELLYPEDLIRSQFMKRYQNYETPKRTFLSQIFVDEYLTIRKMEKYRNAPGDVIFDAVIRKMESVEGIELIKVEEGPRERENKWKKK